MSFDGLVKCISPTLKRITYKLNGHFSFFNEDDLYQEAMAHLWVAYREGRLLDKTPSYILQGCYFHLKNYIRKNYDKAQLLSIDNIIDNDKGMEPSYSGTPHFNLMIDEIKAHGLTKREKDVLSFFLEGMTTREIGKRLGISHVGVVKLWGRLIARYKKLNVGAPFMAPVKATGLIALRATDKSNPYNVEGREKRWRKQKS